MKTRKAESIMIDIHLQLKIVDQLLGRSYYAKAGENYGG